MSLASSNVVYRADLDTGSFRLLTFEYEPWTADSDGILRCRLTTHPLEEAPTFNALSYAWHEPQSVQAATPLAADNEVQRNYVLLNGDKTSVTSNLYLALHELCQHRLVTHWWIDALCINQSNTKERTTQVTIMHRIYRSASTVYVWLGSDASNEAYGVREFFRALIAKYVDDELDSSGDSKYVHGWLLPGDEHTFLASGLPSRHDSIWKCVVRFWDRAWFNRVWVKQEVALAQEVRVWCGSTEFTLSELVETSRFHIWSGLAESLMDLKPENQVIATPSRMIGASTVDFEDLQLFLKVGNDFREADDFKLAADRLCGPKVEDQHPLLRIFAVRLFLTQRDEATDPRDKLFVLLVLMKQIAENNTLPELPLMIDYSKSKEDVFREAIAWIIRESGSLGVLCLLRPDRVKSTVLNGYSWVADCTYPPCQPLRLFETDVSCQTDTFWTGSISDLRPSLKDLNPEVHAKLIGTVADVGDDSDTLVIHGCFERTARLLLNCPPIMSNDLSRLDVWRRTMCGDTSSTSTSNPDDAKDTSRATFKEWLVWVILRRIMVDYSEGRIQRVRDHLAKMPSFELLAETDIWEPKMLPDWAFWQTAMTNQDLVRKYSADYRPPFLFRMIETGGRRLFRTAHRSFIGLGPEGTEPGDEIWVIAGCLLPVVLRRPGSSDADLAEDDHTRSVIGEAYINGLCGMLRGVLSSGWQRLKLK